MELRYLQTFGVLAESPSLTEAAQRLGLTQSAVSLQLKKLEREFGVRLVDRSRHPLTLTPAGLALQREGAALLAILSATREAVQRAATDVAGRLVLSASTTPGEYVLPSLLAGFLAAHPDVEAEVRMGDSAGVYDDLVHGRAAFGFAGFRRDDLGLVLEPFAEDVVVLVGAPGVGPPRITPEGLSEHLLVAREQGSGTMETVRRGLELAGVPGPRPRRQVVLGSTQAVVRAACSGMGLAFVSRLAVEDLLCSGSLVETVLEGVELRRRLWLAFDRGAVEGGLRTTFLAHVRSRTSRSGRAE